MYIHINTHIKTHVYTHIKLCTYINCQNRRTTKTFTYTAVTQQPTNTTISIYTSTVTYIHTKTEKHNRNKQHITKIIFNKKRYKISANMFPYIYIYM